MSEGGIRKSVSEGDIDIRDNVRRRHLKIRQLFSSKLISKACLRNAGMQEFARFELSTGKLQKSKSCFTTIMR
jgi:hypothetical protein